MEFSQDIKDLLLEKFNLTQEKLQDLSLKELQSLREEVEDLKHEYSLLELSQKLLGNGLYGCCANRFFYFYNAALAGDITGECRHLTKTMWDNLEEFFHETLWERKDLWEKFDFELDESKHDWYRGTTVSCYSDTDTIVKNSLIWLNNYKKHMTIEEFYKECYNRNGLFKVTEHGHEIVESFGNTIPNYVDGKLVQSNIKRVIRHKVSKAKFKIKTKSGKEIIVTGDHSCIVFRNGKQMEMKAKDINIKTDKILTIHNHE